jgi:hypothetical protein
VATLGELFQANRAESTLVVLFIPSADRDGNALSRREQNQWVRKALEMLGTRLRGATAMPRGWGVWRDDAKGGQLVWDHPVLIQCFTNDKAIKSELHHLRDFLLDMGRQTNQGAVACVIDRTYFEIEFPIGA